MEGGTGIELVGYNFVSSNLAACKFGDVEAPARWVSATEMRCLTPPKAVESSKEVPVSISLNGVDFFVSPVAYRYSPGIVLAALAPLRGPASGGTILSITGSNFVFSSSLACRFGLFGVPAWYVSSSEVRCVTSKLDQGVVAVTVSNNGVDFAESSLEYRADTGITIFSAWPSQGSVRGGGVVRLEGSGFVNSTELQCLFGTVAATETVFESASVLRCAAPAHREGLVSVGISSNGADAIVSGVQFQFTEDAAMAALSPRSGPVEGGTSVLVTGYNFLDSKNLHCHFGGSAAPTRWLSSTQLECTAPARDQDGVVEVQVSMNGVDMMASSMEYMYTASAIISAVFPSMGPSSGGTELAVSGENFLHTAELTCRIGFVEVAASFVSSREVRCITPTMTVGAQEVTVSLNGLDFSGSSASFSSMRDTILFSASPSLGSVSGGTVVTVQGQGFVNTSGLSCLFDGMEATATWFISESELKCEAPAHEAGAATLEVRINVVDRAISALLFLYAPHPRAVKLSPSSGTIRGGAFVLVDGYGFLNTQNLACRFGNRTGLARFISSSQIACVTPRMSEACDAELQVSHNGEEYEATGLTFTFVSSPTLVSIWPTEGSAEGGLEVFLQGDGFMPSGELACRFGNHLAAARLANTSLLSCLVPSGLPLGSFHVTVTVNGVESAPSGLAFTHLALPRVASVNPRCGLVTGGSRVVVVGEGPFRHGLSQVGQVRCWFGSTLSPSPARALNETTWECVTPWHSEPGESVVTLGTQARRAASSKASFRFLPVASIASVSPASAFLGSESLLLVQGHGFVESQAYECAMAHAEATQARWISASLIECATPAFSKAGDTALRVRPRNAGVNDSTNALPFAIVSSWEATEFSPKSGLVSGGSQVVIHGSGFSTQV